MPAEPGQRRGSAGSLCRAGVAVRVLGGFLHAWGNLVPLVGTTLPALRALPWGTALLSLKPMAKHHLASTAAGQALLCDLMQNRKEMESTGMSCEALCLPIHLRVFYVFLLPPFKSLFGCYCLLEGQSRVGAGVVLKPRSCSSKMFCALSQIWEGGRR